MKKISSLVLLVLFGLVVSAQQKIGGTPGVADPNAYLHLGDSATSNKGLLMPRVVLTSTDNPAPLTAHKAGMYVYNVALDTANKGAKGVTPGMYYNNGVQWVRALNSSEVDVSEIIFGGPVVSTLPATTCNSAAIYTLFVDTATVLSDGISPNPNVGKQWICDGTTWKSYTPPPGTTEWFKYNTTIDAGGDKTGSIYRTGNVAVGIGQAVLGEGTVVLGGQSDTAQGIRSVVIGGNKNKASGLESGIMASFNSVTNGKWSFIGGGFNNSATADRSATIGGGRNSATGPDAFIGGGLYDTATGGYSSIIGGAFNKVAAMNSTLAGGRYNSIFGANSGIIGGYRHGIVTGAGFSFIGGGQYDTANADCSVLVGGEFNRTDGEQSAIIGGHQLKNTYTGCVMMGDYSGTPALPSKNQLSIVNSLVANSFTGMFNGGYRFLTNRADQSLGVMIDASANLYPGKNKASSLGTSTLRWTVVHADNGVISTSDIRLKKNIKPLAYGLKDVLKIEPISYSWKDDNTNKTKVGVSAQQLQTVIPEVVSIGDDAQQTLGVNYAELVPVLINAIKEQQSQIKDLKATSEKQQTQIEELKAKVKAM